VFGPCRSLLNSVPLSICTVHLFLDPESFKISRRCGHSLCFHLSLGDATCLDYTIRTTSHDKTIPRPFILSATGPNCDCVSSTYLILPTFWSHPAPRSIDLRIRTVGSYDSPVRQHPSSSLLSTSYFFVVDGRLRRHDTAQFMSSRLQLSTIAQPAAAVGSSSPWT
jgi:hypothetical protein